MMKNDKFKAECSQHQDEFDQLFPHLSDAKKLVEEEAISQKSVIFNGAIAQVTLIKRRQKQLERLQLSLFCAFALGILMIWGALVWSGYAKWLLGFWMITGLVAISALPIFGVFLSPKGGSHV